MRSYVVLALLSGCSFPDLQSRADASIDAAADAAVDAMSREVRVTRFGGAELTTLVALRDGEGPWTPLVPENGAYVFTPVADRFEILSVCHHGVSRSLQLIHRTLADGNEIELVQCDSDDASDVTVRVTATNVPTNERAWIGVYSRNYLSFVSVNVNSPTPFTIAPGPVDIRLFTRGVTSGKVLRATRSPALDVQQDQNFTFDLGVTASTQTFPLACEGCDGESVSLRNYLVLEGGRNTPVGTGPFTDEYQIPTAAFFNPGEAWGVDLFTQTATGSRRTLQYVLSGAPLSSTLPGPLELTSSLLLETPHLRPSVTFAVSPPTLPIQSYTVSMSTLVSSVSHSVLVDLSSTWIGDVPSYTYTLPDLTAVPELDDDVYLDHRSAIRVTVTRQDTTTRTYAVGRVTREANERITLGKYCGDGIVQIEEACDSPNSSTCSATCTRLP